MTEQKNQIDLSGLSLAELRELQARLEKVITQNTNQEIIRAREQILAIAQNIGIPLKDLIGAKPPRGMGPRGKVEVRYRHPENRELQWTGRGRQPRWIAAWLKDGGTIEDLKVE